MNKYFVIRTSTTVNYVYFSVADTCGENLAWFIGITTPKYQSAIDEFYRLKAEVPRILLG